MRSLDEIVSNATLPNDYNASDDAGRQSLSNEVEPNNANASASANQSTVPNSNTDANIASKQADVSKSADNASERKLDKADGDDLDNSTNADGHDDDLPDDIEKLKKSLRASRGDTRKARKQLKEIERQYHELTGRMSAFEQHKQQAIQQQNFEANKPPESPPEITFDEMVKDPSIIQRRMQYESNAVRNEFREQINRLHAAYARNAHEDYDQVIGNYLGRITQADKQNLENALLTSENPAEYLYQSAKAFEHFSQFPDIDSYRKHVYENAENEIRKKLENELASKNTTQRQQTQPAQQQNTSVNRLLNIPQSLASARATGNSTPSTWNGPRSLESFFGR